MGLIACIADTHYGKYQGDQKHALREGQRRFLRECFFPMIDKLKIREVVHFGDLVENVDIKFDDHTFIIEEFLDPLQKRGIVVHFVNGNHDARFENTNTRNIYEKMLRAYTHKVWIDPAEIHFFGLPILLVPWICPDNRDRSYRAIEFSSAKIAFGHLGIHGFIPGHTDKKAHDIKIFKDFDAVYMGHYHNRNDEENVHYIGAAHGLTFGDGKDKGFSIFDTETRKMTFHRNPFEIFYDLYYNDERKTIKEMIAESDDLQLKDAFIRVHMETNKRQSDWSAYLDHLTNRKPVKLVTRDLTVPLGITDNIQFEANENMLAFMHRYIDEQIDIDLPKNKLKEFFNMADKEAQAKRKYSE